MITPLALPLPIPLWIDSFRDRANCMGHLGNYVGDPVYIGSVVSLNISFLTSI